MVKKPHRKPATGRRTLKRWRIDTKYIDNDQPYSPLVSAATERDALVEAQLCAFRDNEPIPPAKEKKLRAALLVKDGVDWHGDDSVLAEFADLRLSNDESEVSIVETSSVADNTTVKALAERLAGNNSLTISVDERNALIRVAKYLL